MCTFGFITLLTMHLGPRRRLRLITVPVSSVVLIVVVMSLAALDELPHRDHGDRVRWRWSRCCSR